MPIPDNYDQFLAEEARKDKWLSQRLVCERCKHPIQDDSHYEIDCQILCKDCVDWLYKKED